jgi:hypothetical protein
MQMTSFCQLQSFIFSSFRDFCDSLPFKLVQTSELYPSPAFLHPDQSALITAEVPEALWITSCFSCLLMGWYLGKDNDFFLMFGWFLLKLTITPPKFCFPHRARILSVRPLGNGTEVIESD